MSEEKETGKSSSNRETASSAAGVPLTSEQKVAQFNDAAIDRAHARLPRNWRDG